MKRVAKILLWIAGSFLAAVLVLNGAYYVANLKNIYKAASDRKLCDSRLAQLQHDLPIRTPRDEVVRYLQEHGQDTSQFGGTGDQISVNLGKIKSTVWYCSFFVEYADISFTSDIAQNSNRRSLDHIETKSVGECL
jgi:hypothetical protein